MCDSNVLSCPNCSYHTHITHTHITHIQHTHNTHTHTHTYPHTQDLAVHTRVPPEKRAESFRKFVQRLNNTKEVCTTQGGSTKRGGGTRICVHDPRR